MENFIIAWIVSIIISIGLAYTGACVAKKKIENEGYVYKNEHKRAKIKFSTVAVIVIPVYNILFCGSLFAFLTLSSPKSKKPFCDFWKRLVEKCVDDGTFEKEN